MRATTENASDDALDKQIKLMKSALETIKRLKQLDKKIKERLNQNAPNN